MRMMMTASIPVDVGNAAISDGSLGATLKGILEDLKPEAAYFTTGETGERTAILFLEMKDSAEIVRVAEPFFLRFEARVTFQPVMNPEDLAAGMSRAEGTIAKK
jgi:hypothetical protein